MMKRRLIYFGTNRLKDMIHKGNVWYVRHYEAYFDEVYVVYLMGGSNETVSRGKTHLVGLGSGRNECDLFLAPFRLWRFAREVRATSYLTADLIFSWWTAFLIRILMKAEIVLMPVCMPHIIYKSSGGSLSPLPVWIERIFLGLSFKASARVLTCRAFGDFVQWLSNTPGVKDKLKVVNTIVDAVPPAVFIEKSAGTTRDPHSPSRSFVMLYVGRLHPEKLVDQLIRMVKVISDHLSLHPLSGFEMIVIGDGPERDRLEALSESLGVGPYIRFRGFLPNEEIAEYYRQASVFVSPLTGNSLREAALFALPIVAYEMDWVVGVFQHEENILFARPGDFEHMAEQVMRLAGQPKLAFRIGQKARELALGAWGKANLEEELSRAFE